MLEYYRKFSQPTNPNKSKKDKTYVAITQIINKLNIRVTKLEHKYQKLKRKYNEIKTNNRQRI